MKKTLTIIAAVAMLSQIASAQLLKNFKYNGSLEINGYNVNNIDFDKNSDDKVSDVDTRLMVDMSFDLSDDANAVVSIVKNNRQWGDNSENANAIQNNLFFEQAYINLKGVVGMDHKIGRQYYGNPGDMVIYYGPLYWPYDTGLTVSALDAWVGTYNYNDWIFTALLAKEINGNLSSPDNDKNISGISVKGKISRWTINPYIYYSNDKKTTPGVSDYLAVIGTKINWDCTFDENLKLGLEYNKNMGKDLTASPTPTKHKGFAYKINADYSMDLAGKLGLMAEYTFMSGQDSSSDDKVYRPINSDYRPGIIANGYGVDTTYVGAIGTGYKGLHFGANWTPSSLEKLNLALTYYNMKVAEKNPNMKDTIGNELDIVATWKHSDNIHVKGYYAMFKPEKDNTLTDDAQTMLGAAFVVKF